MFTIANGLHQLCVCHEHTSVNERVFNRFITCPRNIRVTEATRKGCKGGPLHLLRFEASEFCFESLYNPFFVRKLVPDHVVETTKERSIQDLGVIGCRNDQTVRMILFNEL